MSETPFIERRFDLDGRELVVRFYLPARNAGKEYRCCWAIGWPEGEVKGQAAGEDGVQALMLAMRKVHSDLIATGHHASGKLTLWGQVDLDLPPTWGNGSLYDLRGPKR